MDTYANGAAGKADNDTVEAHGQFRRKTSDGSKRQEEACEAQVHSAQVHNNLPGTRRGEHKESHTEGSTAMRRVLRIEVCSRADSSTPEPGATRFTGLLPNLTQLNQLRIPLMQALKQKCVENAELSSQPCTDRSNKRRFEALSGTGTDDDQGNISSRFSCSAAHLSVHHLCNGADSPILSDAVGKHADVQHGSKRLKVSDPIHGDKDASDDDNDHALVDKSVQQRMQLDQQCGSDVLIDINDLDTCIDDFWPSAPQPGPPDSMQVSVNEQGMDKHQDHETPHHVGIAQKPCLKMCSIPQKKRARASATADAICNQIPTVTQDLNQQKLVQIDESSQKEHARHVHDVAESEPTSVKKVRFEQGKSASSCASSDGAWKRVHEGAAPMDVPGSASPHMQLDTSNTVCYPGFQNTHIYDHMN